MINDKLKLKELANSIVDIVRDNLESFEPGTFLTEIDLIGPEAWRALDVLEQCAVERILPAAIDSGMLFDLAHFKAVAGEILYYCVEW